MDVKDIESAISQLPPAEVAELADWFAQFHAELWDKQIADDLKAGRLQNLLEEAKQDFESGRCDSL
jgi:hypothetical protein